MQRRGTACSSFRAIPGGVTRSGSFTNMWLGGLSGGSIRGWLGMGKSRGAAVPFETPALRMARVCEDERDGLTAIMRDFANNGSTYMVPWTSLPLMVTMTESD